MVWGAFPVSLYPGCYGDGEAISMFFGLGGPESRDRMSSGEGSSPVIQADHHKDDTFSPHQ